MKVMLSKYAGFCGGVKRAYEIVEKLSKDPQAQKPIVVLGSLVHNTDVVKRIEEMGVKKIDFSGNIEDVEDKIDEKIGTLVATAHGIGPEIFEIARKKGVNLVDTTCPKVIKVQRLAQVFLNRGDQVVIVGEKKHKEVQGIYGWSQKKANIVENENDVENLNLDEDRNITVVSQTTQIRDWVNKISKSVCKKYPKSRVYETVCDTTKDRQSEVAEIAKSNDTVFVIGSSESSNSNRLYEISKEINPDTHFIERVSDIKEEWLAGKNTVAVTAGASSPNWVIDEVVEFLKNY